MGARNLRLRTLWVAAALAAAALLPGCTWFEEERQLAEVFVVLLCLSTLTNFLLVLVIVLYFLPFTRPKRKPKRRR